MAFSRRAVSVLRGRGSRSLGIGVVVVSVLALVGCFGSDGAGPLFGSPVGGGTGAPGFQPGAGGGVQMFDLFVNARLLAANPTIISTYPEDGAETVSPQTPIMVVFSESVVFTGASLQLFPSGSNLAVTGATQLFQGQSVAVFVPDADLQPETTYELVIQGNVTDLQGQQLEAASEDDLRFTFETTTLNDEPPFRVAASTPFPQANNVERSSEILILFSEPAAPGEQGGGLFAPDNIQLRIDGTLQTPGESGDYTQTSVGLVQPIGVLLQIPANTRFPANASVETRIAARVEAADGLETLGGQDFVHEWTAQDASVPTAIQSDAFISTANTNSFDVQVDFTDDGAASDTTNLIFFDRSSQNSLVFRVGADSPTVLNGLDLQPEESEALRDGEIIVGAYSERQRFVSEVTVIRTIEKNSDDLVGPRLVRLGPPETFFMDRGILHTRVRDPIVYGNMDEPTVGVQVDFNATDPDMQSIQFAQGLSTVTDNFFVTAPSADFVVPFSLDILDSMFVIASDIFGNVTPDTTQTPVISDLVALQTVDLVGAASSSPDALFVTAFHPETFRLIGLDGSGEFGIVVVDEFPADTTPMIGVTQFVRGLAAGGGGATFPTALLPTTPQISVTIIANGFEPVTFAGLDNPAMGTPIALMPVLRLTTPAADPTVNVDVQGGDAAATVLVGAVAGDLDPAAGPEERNIELAAALSLPSNRMQIVAAHEDSNGMFRFTSSEPFALAPTDQITRTLDFTGQSLYSAATAASPRTVTFNGNDVASMGAVGLEDPEATQYRRARLLAFLPGVMTPVSIFEQEGADFVSSGADRTATVLKPGSFETNDSIASTGVEDTSVELFLQPNLIDDASAVDLAIQDQRLRTELHIEDTSSGAFTRQRFLSGTVNQTASLLAVPSLTSGNAQAHPAFLSWTNPTTGPGTNAAHCLTLEEPGGRRWSIYLAGDQSSFQLPSIADGESDGAGTVAFEFGDPGGSSVDYDVTVGSYDFDGNADFLFDVNLFFLTDLEREHMRAARTAPEVLTVN